MNAKKNNLELSQLIDRLVDGELPEQDRQALLRRLEIEPDGWRTCALTFLEAQTWRATFREVAEAPRQEIMPAKSTKSKFGWGFIPRVALLAASLLLTFYLGHSIQPTAREVVQQPVETPSEITVKNTPLEKPSESVPVSTPQTSKELAELTRLWAERGFFTELQERKLTLQMQDGRTVTVPVQEVYLHHPGNRTY
ncbi:hypothetical protein KIH39_25445 [Telmatocola sphagniphila]|uniref:Uncharacterized protein n=1 Tax=Telmatocola sphagniphila TaxID=1123043 RepID=A0A8E6EY92_9BACT|nr:hypothetical protein [Telmatocola sphagniphila]QVL32141.1 hypothetical protein KIH39_25445 [Telmatocola sphagniphila]